MLERALPPALLSLLLVATRVSAAPYDFTDNYRDPAPAPEDGPPASYHATRDKSVLPYEICGIVGGYVFTVLIWGVLLLTVGRRMRRKALEPPKQLELELENKPARPTIKTPGLTSPPLSARSWLRKFKKNDSVPSSPQSPVVQSPSSFDQKVLDAHRDQDQADMERLYAAVMEFDAKKQSARASVDETEPLPPPTDRRRPSAISVARSQDNYDSPASPVRAIYPPGHQDRPTTASNTRDRLRAEQPAPASPRSILSKRSQTSNATTSSKNTRFNLKNLRISGPIAKYPGADDDDEARRPLTPRFYAPGAPPSPPTQTNSPTSPYEADESLDRVQPLPHPAPHRRGSSTTSNNPGLTISTPPPPSKQKTATSPNQSLPLRSFASPLNSPGIQTTVLDRRVDRLALGTPKTGVPFTPYSPYMPFTPVTPVTPHLTTRRDRKMERKMEGRRRRGGEEMVQTPKEIFGDAY
ncbi:hypothetical protein J3E72DRAFT_35549 [Bipolaris maydis]|nr:hypothetical protein BM1_01706 [Bipolaris maydis]KAJ5027565.1 hypothetical protein J3E73DRAFT_35837 [Bipolaris maydis]KAJ5062318.1 hypothetical protein J3E74DRAFT_32097 [Bipolaris maydis]KAJ6191742.1 hypothetical protein J3E72DRAFT_39113 [Bipolaris maydis]KAJ6198595.1 hypothetical protein J3E72DRAFT_35549 [Bipolaris maydis]